jgi:hypothetical protein
MKSFVFVLGGVLACAGALSAQEDTTPRFEVGVLYSGNHLNAGQNNSQITGNGGAGYFEYNINKWLGAVADLGGYANTNNRIDDKLFTYMFGPDSTGGINTSILTRTGCSAAPKRSATRPAQTRIVLPSLSAVASTWR